jgi:hypothetical protein
MGNLISTDWPGQIINIHSGITSTITSSFTATNAMGIVWDTPSGGC